MARYALHEPGWGCARRPAAPAGASLQPHPAFCYTTGDRACSSAAEQGAHNPWVAGSNPAGPIHIGERSFSPARPCSRRSLERRSRNRVHDGAGGEEGVPVRLKRFRRLLRGASFIDADDAPARLLLEGPEQRRERHVPALLHRHVVLHRDHGHQIGTGQLLQPLRPQRSVVAGVVAHLVEHGAREQVCPSSPCA